MSTLAQHLRKAREIVNDPDEPGTEAVIHLIGILGDLDVMAAADITDEQFGRAVRDLLRETAR